MTAAVPGAEGRIVQEVTSWAGVTTGVGEFGETEFFVRGRMIGHVHGDELVEAKRDGGLRRPILL